MSTWNGVIDKPKHTVINATPTASETVSAFRTSDWTTVATGTLFGYPFGYWMGHKHRLHRSASMLGMYVFGSFAFGMVFQDSMARLRGHLPNEQEVAESLRARGSAAAGH